MFRHLIVLSSSYKLGKRIAIHLLDTEDDLVTLDGITNLDIFKYCSVYNVETDSDTWDSVVEYDGFYEDIYICTSSKEFVDLINADRDISVFDLSKYILASLKKRSISCSHLKLQKLAYFCYEKYLISYKKKLFNEKIYAWKYGPVIKSLYDSVKQSENSTVDLDSYVKQSKNLTVDLDSYTTRQRIIFSDDGFDKLRIIDEVLEEYGELSADRLVDLSHKEGTAWSTWDRETMNYEITDELILKNLIS